MLSWMHANFGTIVICAVLTVIVAFAIAVVVRDKKKGKSACGCNCEHCPMSGSCHSH